MLAATQLLESLAEDDMQERKDCNNDHDFGKVLTFCSDDTIPTHTIRYSDGQEESFSFDTQK